MKGRTTDTRQATLPRVSVAVFAAALVLGSAGALAAPPRATAENAPMTIGLWLWTRHDADAFSRVRARNDALRPAVHVATVRLRGGQVAWDRGLSPAAGRVPGGAVVIRIDDSMHPTWIGADPETIASSLTHVVEDVLAQCAATSAPFTEVQLDYDAPARLAASWVRAASLLARGPLRGYDVWITSVPSDLDATGYAQALAETGIGHVLQLFDTGLPCTDASEAHVLERLAALRTPFRLGVGAFERVGRTRGEHACWTARSVALHAAAGYRGTWIFPGHAEVEPLLDAVSGSEPQAGGPR